jgi:hypothetical protein
MDAADHFAPEIAFSRNDITFLAFRQRLHRAESTHAHPEEKISTVFEAKWRARA